MRLLQYKVHGEVKLGLKTEEGILDVKKMLDDFEQKGPSSVEEVIKMGDQSLSLIKELLAEVDRSDYINEDTIEFSPIIENPEKIICVGLNYKPHVEESKMNLPEEPVLFSKFNNALSSHNAEIELPSIAEKYDYEAELVLVIGKHGKNISKEDALSYVFGYSVGNDLSARDLQMKSGQWLIGKTLNDFAPIGPYLVTSDEIDPSNLSIECKVNGELRQSSNTNKMIFDCATLVSYISHYVDLKPGDVIFSGTPEGVILGYEKDKQEWLKSGDIVEVNIGNLGSLKNTFK